MGDQYIFTNIYAQRETQRGRENERISYNGNRDEKKSKKEKRQMERWTREH